MNIRTRFVLLILICELMPFLIPGLWTVILGVAHFNFIFLDIFGVLSAADANAAGLDAFRFNPLDVLHRPHVYSSWWLLISHTGLSRFDYLAVGAMVSGAFIIAVLSIINPKNTRELLISFLCICSPAVYLGVERANVDLIIFCLLALAPVLINHKNTAGLIGSWAIVFISMALKYYPVLCFFLILSTSRNYRLTFIYIFTGFAATAIYLLYYLDTFMLLRHTIPAPSNILSIGGKLLFLHLGVRDSLSNLFTIILFLIILFIASRLIGKKSGTAEYQLDSTAAEYFVLGSCVLLFCFFTTSNFEYREIFFIFLLPFLFEMIRNNNVSNLMRTVITIQIYLIPLLMWSETIGRICRSAYQLAFHAAPALYWQFILKDLLSWVVFSLMLCLLYSFLRYRFIIFNQNKLQQITGK